MARSALKKIHNELAVEETSARIRAYVAALIPLRGCAVSESWHRGRGIVEEFALSCEGADEPRKPLTLEECADVLAFMHHSEPRDVEAFHANEDDVPNVQCGLMEVLIALEEAVRRDR